VFYGWWIVGLALLAQGLSVGATAYVVGQYIKPLAEEFGATRTQVMLGFALMMLAGGLGSPALGRALDRRSLRKAMILGAAAMAAGFAAMSVMRWLPALLVPLILLVAPGSVLFGPLAASTAVARWFARLRGRALGIAAVGTSLGGLTLPLLNAWALVALGWRGALLVLAALIAGLGIPLVAWRMVDRPEELGLGPDGDEPLPAPEAGHAAAPAWSLRGLLGHYPFWAIALGTGLPLAVVGSVLGNLHGYATDLGISDGRAALLLSGLSLGGVLGKLTFGALADRVDKRALLLLAQGILIVFLVLLLQHPGYPVLLAGTSAAGIALGGLLPVWGALLGDYYGRERYGQVMGLMAPLMLPPNLVAPVAGTWAYDATGSYDVAFQVFIGVVALAGVLAARLRPPRVEPDRVALAGAAAGGS
jgi:MFS family permease